MVDVAGAEPERPAGRRPRRPPFLDYLVTAQYKALLKKIQQQTGPVILAGDFNAGRNSQSVRLLVDSGFEILTNDPANTFPSDQPKVEIDFIMCKGLPLGRFEHQVGVEKIASDHRPVLVEIFK